MVVLKEPYRPYGPVYGPNIWFSFKTIVESAIRMHTVLIALKLLLEFVVVLKEPCRPCSPVFGPHFGLSFQNNCWISYYNAFSTYYTVIDSGGCGGPQRTLQTLWSSIWTTYFLFLWRPWPDQLLECIWILLLEGVVVLKEPHGPTYIISCTVCIVIAPQQYSWKKKTNIRTIYWTTEQDTLYNRILPPHSRISTGNSYTGSMKHRLWQQFRMVHA